MKKALIALAVVVGVIVIAAVAASLLLDANRFRPALAARMSDALGRRVEIGNLKISLFSGGAAAEDVVIMDDAAFSKEPFVSAKSVSLGVDLMPLIFSHSLRVQSFTLDHPRVALIRSKTGTWNFSSLGSGQSSNGSGCRRGARHVLRRDELHRTGARPPVAIGPLQLAAVERRVEHRVEEVVVERQPAARELPGRGCDLPAAVEEQSSGGRTGRRDLEAERNGHAIREDGAVPSSVDLLRPGGSDGGKKEQPGQRRDLFEHPASNSIVFDWLRITNGDIHQNWTTQK